MHKAANARMQKLEEAGIWKRENRDCENVKRSDAFHVFRNGVNYG